MSNPFDTVSGLFLVSGGKFESWDGMGEGEIITHRKTKKW